MTAPAPAAPDDLIEPGQGGDPAAPQPCQFGTEAAVRSLLFRDGDAYVPVCDRHEADARQQLADAGETVSGVVEIEQPDDAVTAAAEPVEVGPEQGGELAVRFPVVVIEGMQTSDGRLLEPGSLTHRTLPISLLALPESAHGGDDPGPAVLVGRIDTLTRHPGPDVVSPRTGEPFPEGTFVWSGTGAIQADHPAADLVRRRFLRGVSVDLAGVDVTLSETVEPGEPQMVAHHAEIAAATLVCIPAFSDAYVELDDGEAFVPITPEELPPGLVASAIPAWRSAELGDYPPNPAITAAADAPTLARIPADAADQLAQVISDDGGQQRDADELAAAIVAMMLANWAPDPADDPDDELAAPVTAAAADTPAAPTTGTEDSDDLDQAPDGPHTGGMIALVPAQPDQLAVDGGEPADELHLTLAYLGDNVTAWPDDQRAHLIDAARDLAATIGGPLQARAMGHALFNPDGGDDGDKTPCAVYLIGDAADVADLYEQAGQLASQYPDVPPPHNPPILHITAGYGLDPGALTFTGPVVFDKLRVALGGDVTDIPLGDTADATDGATGDGADGPPDEASMAAAPPEADATLPDAPADSPDVGMPDEPQPCPFDGSDHPATHSLIFVEDGAPPDAPLMYVPACDAHDDAARQAIADIGAEVTQEVPIVDDGGAGDDIEEAS